MRGIRSAFAALTAVLCVIAMTGTAEARKGGGHGGHGGHGHGHHGHGHHGHGHHGWGRGLSFGWYAPTYGYYDSWDDDDDCYRVRRYGRWRIVCR